jgi:hypothetical protein
MERSDHAEVIGMLCGVRKKITDGKAAFAVILESKRRLHEVPDGSSV